MITRSEIVELFYEGEEPVGILILNGHAQFYKISRASKDFVRETLLEVKNNETEGKK